MYQPNPFYPASCGRDTHMRLPLFAPKPCGKPPRPPRPPKHECCEPIKHCHSDCCPALPAAPPICVVNPWNSCERATVILKIDECGNLLVCVKRD